MSLIVSLMNSQGITTMNLMILKKTKSSSILLSRSEYPCVNTPGRLGPGEHHANWAK